MLEKNVNIDQRFFIQNSTHDIEIDKENLINHSSSTTLDRALCCSYQTFEEPFFVSIHSRVPPNTKWLQNNNKYLQSI